MPQLFGTSGVRGVSNSEIDVQLCASISLSFATYYGTGKYAVGHDTRYGAEMLSLSAASALMSAGCDVHSIGCVPMGAFASYIVSRNLKGGILITGSHMPPERIGIICMNSHGAYIPNKDADAIEKIMRKKSWKKAPPERIGSVYRHGMANSMYMKRLLKMVNTEAIKGRRYRVLCDPGGGTACYVLPKLLRAVGCSVKIINGNPTPEPSRPSEPTEESLKEATALVRREYYDIGIATDTDADRVVFIDERGKVISTDVMGAVFAERLLTKGDRCVVPINSSSLINHVCDRIGAKLYYSRIGQPAIMECIKKYGAKYAYEESGKYFLVDYEYWCDGILSALKVLEIMAAEEKKISEITSGYPTYRQRKIKIECKDEMKSKVMYEVSKMMRDDTNNVVKDVKIDGIKRIYSDGSWLLIRKSGTEPIIRVFSESRDKKKVEELISYGKDVVKRAMQKLDIE